MMRRIAREGWRQMVLLVAMLLAFCFLAHNLFILQVARPANAQMAAFYAQDITASQIQTPPRETIVDATGAPLVHQILQMLFNTYQILPPSTPPIQPNTLCPGPLQ